MCAPRQGWQRSSAGRSRLNGIRTRRASARHPPPVCAPRTRTSISSTARLATRELVRIARPQHHVGVRAALRIEERIAADRHVRIGLGDLAELAADVALARIGQHGLGQHAHAGLELGRDLVEHRLHDRRHARHDDDVADPDAGRARHLVEHEIGALRDARHPHARLVHLASRSRRRAPPGSRARADRRRSRRRTPWRRSRR